MGNCFEGKFRNSFLTSFPPVFRDRVPESYFLISYSIKVFLDSLYGISEKYKPVHSLNVNFLQNSPIVQIYTSANDCKGGGIIPGSHFVKAFSAIPWDA